MSDKTIEWNELEKLHTSSIQRIKNIVSKLNADQWRTPIKKDGWDPAQIVHHVIQIYAVMLKQIEQANAPNEKPPLKVRTDEKTRQMLRKTVFPKILKGRKIPDGAQAPHELQPSVLDESPRELINALETKANRLAEHLRTDKSNEKFSLTHHLFGNLNAHQALNFITIHNEHHTKQLADFVAQQN